MAWLAEPHSEGGEGVGVGAPDRSAEIRRSSTSTLTHRLLAALGVPAGAVVAALREADQQDDGGDAATVLMAWGVLDPAEWWPALAAALGLGYRAHIEPVPAGAAPIPAAALDREARLIWTADPAGPLLAVAPCGDTTARLSAFLAAHPMLRSRVVVTSAEAVRAGLRRQMRATMTEAAVTGLRRSRPHMSASRPPRAWPVRLAGALLAASPFAAVLLGFGVEALLLAVFLPLTLLRLVAAIDPVRPRPPPRLADGDLPRYAVLVPLHHEATMLPQLATALAALDYPRHKLDLKLLVEADDAPTYAAAMAYAARGGWDVVVVPPSLPRTKPKALAFGLQLVDAELVTVFDAEDRPAPDQLRRAAAALMAAPANVACLQAALTIDRRSGDGRRGWACGWLAGQFALEYRIQFFGLLPWFAACWGFFLLGGTSNHFRHAALAAVGGWDPYNVTEDADIAVRLRRAGWRIGVLASETLEEAPSSLAVWSAQRCRWLKGWMQTWLVHMRHPGRLVAELGPGGFVLFQLLLGGQIISAFVYPASLLAVGLVLTGVRPLLQARSFVEDIWLMMALVSGALAWGSAGILALRMTPPRRWPGTVLRVAALPIYWLLLYPAVIRAMLELAAAPFHWNKTPHGEARAQRTGDGR